MKQFILLAILLGLISCQPQNNEVTIKGKFIGDIPKELAYSVPVNGISYGFFGDTVIVDSTGRFEFKVLTDKPCFIKFFQYHFTGHLIAEPGKTYQVTIHASDNQYQVTYDGYRSKLQEVYQNLNHSTPPQIDAMQFVRPPITQATKQLDSLQQSEEPILEKVFNEEEISPELIQLVKLDRTLYYATVRGYVALYKYLDGYQAKKFKTIPDNLKNMWSETVKQIPVESNQILRSVWAYYFLENYANYKEYTDTDFDVAIYRGLREKGVRNTHRINVAKKYLTGDNLELFKAAYLLSVLRGSKFEKELIPLFNDFKSEYPNSKYTPYLEPYIKNVIDFHQIAEQDISKESIFLDNYDKIKTLDECLLSFKGKKVYVDIWATWCGPCKEEFTYNTELKKMLKSKDVNILYISLDKDKDSIQWKNMIKYYHLTGYHVRAAYALHADLTKLLGRFGIPRYLLIDEKGNIVNDKAEHPSHLKELKNQIDEM